MATSTDSTSIDSGALASLLKLVTGSGTTTTSGSSQTQTTSISAETANALVKQMLESTSGLASVASGQKSAGMYNSTVNTQLVNDLLARVSAQVASNNKTVTTTSSGGTQRTGAAVDPMQALMTLAAGTIGQQVIKKSGLGTAFTSGIDKASEALASALGLGPADASAFATSGTIGADALATTAGVEGAAGLGTLGTGVAEFAAEQAAASTGLITGLGSVLDAGAGIAGAELATTAAATDVGLAALGDAFAADMLGIGIGGSAAAAGAAEAAALAGTAEAAATAATAAEGAGLLEAAATAAVAWVICTELRSTGEMPPALYEKGSPHFRELPAHVTAGYHLWAVPYTRLMRRNKLARAIVKPVAIARAKHLAGDRNFVGWLTVVIGEPICGLLGKLVTRKTDWKSLYKGA